MYSYVHLSVFFPEAWEKHIYTSRVKAHTIESVKGQLEMIEVQSIELMDEGDILRFDDVYGGK